MKVPLKWLNDYVDINMDPNDFSDALTMSGSKVEALDVLGEDISGVVAGKIESLKKHPDADNLQVSMVDVGSEKLQIVTGAKNVSVGDIVPIALEGANLPGGMEIKKTTLRGIESLGMMCSIHELGVAKEDYPKADENGIFLLAQETAPGSDIKDILGLNDTVVEFEITSNRPDCLSVLGIARETAATYRSKFKKPEIKVSERGDDADSYATVKIEAPDLCPRYAARIVKDIKIAPSPDWMKNRLRSAGVRPISNIVDITNYIMLEYGQPMHAFDFKNLKDSTIVVRRAKDGEVMNTLDDQERKLDSSMLVIADTEKPVAVAGVMGGANSEISDNTNIILLESANFNGTSVRLTAKKLGMRTESSSRFEKGLDIDNVVRAIDRAAQLIEELGAGTVCRGVIDCYPEKKEERTIKLNPENINALLGTDISAREMIDILNSVELTVDENSMEVNIPGFRADVEREADLAEEVARFYGYNNIKPTLLAGKASTQGRKSYEQKIEDIIINTAISCGLSEAYTYSFMSPKVFDKLGIPTNSELRRAVKISNPLGEDFSIMRTTTIPAMLSSIGVNYNRRNEECALFELARTYKPKDDSNEELPEEKNVLTIGMYGNYDFYDLKGIVEEIVSAVGINDYEFERDKASSFSLPGRRFSIDYNYSKNHDEASSCFHPGRSAQLMINGKKAGIIGQIHPQTAENFEISTRVYMGVIDIEPLVKNSNLVVEYKPLPKYPAVTRDIAMLVKDEVPVKQIEDEITKNSGNILESLRLFDVYKGEQITEGMKSVAYSISFRSSDRTLKDEEVNRVMDNILLALKNNLDADLRD